MIKLLIADDHALVREGLKRVVEGVADISVVGEAASGQEAIDQVRKLSPDVLLLDLSMPGRGGLDALKELHQRYPSLRILVLSMHPEEQFGVRCLRDGAAGYLSKESASDHLLTAIRRVANGGKYIGESLAEVLVTRLDASKSQEPHELLSNREFQILRLLASGRRVKEISDDLCLSVKTISTYRSRLLQKTGLENNSQLIRYALRHRLIELE